MSLQSDDPTGAKLLREWINGLRNHDVARPPHPAYQRLLHPGIKATRGPGFLGATAQGRVHMRPGEGPQSISLLHYMRTAPPETLDAHEFNAMLGGLLTFTANRRCELAPEIYTHEKSGRALAHPLSELLDSTLQAPFPEWHAVNKDLMVTLAHLASMDLEDAQAICAAIHMHYCASLLLPHDMTGAFTLAVGGIECLAQRFGNPPTDWKEWDRASSWEKFFTSEGFSETQSAALRDKLMKDQHIRLAETFANYASCRVPSNFWTEPIDLFTWQIDGDTGEVEGGAWSKMAPTNEDFAVDRSKLKSAFKSAYRNRSQFVHAGKRTTTFSADIFGPVADPSSVELSFARIRGSLRALIQAEITSHGTADLNGLDEVRVAVTPIKKWTSKAKRPKARSRKNR